ncbi:hypothetical protein, partial [Bradyrhizobium sp. IC4061]
CLLLRPTRILHGRLLREDPVGGLWFVALLQGLKDWHGILRALAGPIASLSAHFDLKDSLFGAFIEGHGHVPIFQAHCLVRPKAGIAHEEDEVVQLLAPPVVFIVLELSGSLPGRLVELAVFTGGEPGAMRNFAVLPIRL